MNAKKISVHFDSQEEHNLAIKTLMAMGFKYHSAENGNEAVSRYASYRTLNLSILGDNKQLSGSGSNLNPANRSTLSQVLNWVLKPYVEPISVVLNDTHTAIVGDGGVTVGCQTFTFAKMDELFGAIEKIKKQVA